MTLLPLLYPEVFHRFNPVPPPGVFFHGPPGTGKTLLAWALSASCRVSPSLIRSSDLESRELIKIGFDFGVIEEDLPYLEVHPSMLNVNGSGMPTLTFRMWIGAVYDWVRPECIF